MKETIDIWAEEEPCIAYHHLAPECSSVRVKITDERGEWYGFANSSGDLLRCQLVKESMTEKVRNEADQAIDALRDRVDKVKRNRTMAIQKEMQRQAAANLGLAEEADALASQIAELLK